MIPAGMNLRNYGLGDYTDYIRGRPSAKPITDPETIKAIAADDGCPNCHCLDVMEVTVEVEHPQLRGGDGVGKYLGCPACPWASPMVITASG